MADTKAPEPEYVEVECQHCQTTLVVDVDLLRVALIASGLHIVTAEEIAALTHPTLQQAVRGLSAGMVLVSQADKRVLEAAKVWHKEHSDNAGSVSAEMCADAELREAVAEVTP